MANEQDEEDMNGNISSYNYHKIVTISIFFNYHKKNACFAYSLTQHCCTLSDRDYWFEEANAALKRRLSLLSRRDVAKNVVLLVGDGVGLATLTAARIFKGQRQGQHGESSHLAWEKFPAVALAKVSAPVCLL